MDCATDGAYREIVAHYEACLSRHGDNHMGVDWPRAADAGRRYAVMLGVIPASAPRPIRLLDFGCGAGHLLEYIRRNGLAGLEYHGLDISPMFISVCRGKFPDDSFRVVDVLEDGPELPEFDYVIMNGVFTEKCGLSHERMWEFVRGVLGRVWPQTRHGLAFNVMSKHVDWERDDLFHLSCDTLLAFLKAELSRHCVIRQDYGLYEYTTYVYREASRWPG
jgi:SAM-dependent methyltransferase